MSVLKIIGYVAFFLVSFVFSLYWTFPWSVAKDRVLAIASKQMGSQITAERLEPSWVTGIIAENVKIQSPKAESPLELTRIDARAHVFSFLAGNQGGTVKVPIAKGTVEADVESTAETLDVEAHVQGVELALIPGLADAVGLPLSGVVAIDADVDLDKKDTKKTQGTLRVSGKGLEILKGGKMSGFPIPELVIGDFDWDIPIESGVAKFSKQTVKGENVEIVLDGQITILNPPARSNLKMDISFKPTAAFLKKEPLLGALLNNIKRAKGPKGFYNYSARGLISRPRFTPKRR